MPELDITFDVLMSQLLGPIMQSVAIMLSIVMSSSLHKLLYIYK